MTGRLLLLETQRVFQKLPPPESGRIFGTRQEAILISTAENNLLKLDEIYPNDKPEEPPHQHLWELWARFKSQWEAVHEKQNRDSSL